MSIEIKDRERKLSLNKIHVEGVDSGLSEDLRYRPNKYFQKIEDIDIDSNSCTVHYGRELFSVENDVSLKQVSQVLWGVIDAKQRVAQDQVFYLYPGVEAFGVDRRQNLRVGLINARPQSDADCSSEELCVDAFLQLLANHCQSGHKRVVRYNKSILTLRHLQQVLEGRAASSTLWGGLVLLLVCFSTVFALYNWGPKRVRGYLQNWTGHVMVFGERMLRSGSDEWYAKLRKERLEKEYKYLPIPMTFLIHSKAKGKDKFQEMDQYLRLLLASEFPKTKYQIFSPTSLPANEWQRLCSTSKDPKYCEKNSWLLKIKNYRGGFRPLVAAMKESFERAKRKSIDSPEFSLSFSGFFTAAYMDMKEQKKPAKAKATKKKEDAKKPEGANKEKGKAPAQPTPERKVEKRKEAPEKTKGQPENREAAKPSPTKEDKPPVAPKPVERREQAPPTP